MRQLLAGPFRPLEAWSSVGLLLRSANVT